MSVFHQKILKYSKMLILVILIVLTIYILPTYREPEVFRNFITPGERAHVIQEAKKNLTPSTVSTEHNLDESIRKSETAWLSFDDPIIKGIAERCLSYTDRPLTNCEKLQVLRYEEGGHYIPHQDILRNAKNQRMYTFILALNDDYEGGETVFPKLKKAYKLNAGDALFFDTLDNYEFDTSKALHGGRPVKSGEKWICNLWVRKYPITDA